MIVSQLTARRDYAVARMLHQERLLSGLFTDAYYNPNKIQTFKLLDRVLPKKTVCTYQRYQPNIPHALISHDWWTALRFRYQMLKFDNSKKHIAQVNAYRKITKNVIKFCIKNPQITSYYGLDTASLEFFNWAKPKGFSLLLDQCVAPRSTQIKMHNYFQESYGVDEQESIDNCFNLKQREEAEWELADKIMVPSSFVKEELIEVGVPVEKIYLVPFGYDPPQSLQYRKQTFLRRVQSRKKKVRVMFAGSAILRKGIYEFLDIAKKFSDEYVEFIVVGTVERNIVSALIRRDLRNVELLGKLSLPDLHKEYAKADVFLFPSHLEGSARVIFEAMSWGIPIITTNQTGSVITHGIEGFLTDAGDTEIMSTYLQSLCTNSDLRYTMGQSSLDTVQKYSLNHYTNSLIAAIKE